MQIFLHKKLILGPLSLTRLLTKSHLIILKVCKIVQKVVLKSVGNRKKSSLKVWRITKSHP